MYYWKLILLVGALVNAAASAFAADIEAWDIPAEIDFVHIKGEITRGDAERFEEVIEGRDRVTVILESPGGLVNEALRIGANIRMRNFATMVVADGRCYSACGLIWVAGARRYMSASSQIGFHAAYREEAGEFRESGMANAEIGSFLTHLGLRIEAIRYFTVAGPRDFVLLSPPMARALGIEVFQQDGSDIISPDDAPSADVLADRFVSYGLMNSRCLGFLQPDTDVIEDGAKRSMEQGQRLVSNEQWLDLWLPMISSVTASLESDGILDVCLQNESFLRARGQPTGIDGPSFDCGMASTDTERALCSDPDLWAKDRAMNAIYFYVRGYDNPQVRQTILANQREWLRTRNACGSNTTCLNRTYDDRLRFFSGVDVGAEVLQ